MADPAGAVLVTAPQAAGYLSFNFRLATARVLRVKLLDQNQSL